MNAPTKAPLRLLLLAVLGIVAVWAISGLVLYTLKDRGTFGDMFGAVNALFSGLAFAALIYTVHLQRIELALQRQELTLTRRELEGQKLQLLEQSDLMRAENFESSFFRVLGVLADIVNAMDVYAPSGGPPIRGRDCFNQFYRQFRESYNALQPQLSKDATSLEIIDQAYARFYSKNQSDVGHYFRTLYNLVKFVDRSSVEDKRFYTNLVRAQLSSSELLLLYYNCLTEFGREKFKPLVEKYALLKTVPMNLLVRPDHYEEYAPGAFGDR